MAKKTTTTEGVTEKRPRNPRAPKHYLAQLHGVAHPLVIVAKSHDDALKGVVTLKVASYEDMMTAEKQDYEVLDLTKPAEAAE